jgi:hypothetical protein
VPDPTDAPPGPIGDSGPVRSTTDVNADPAMASRVPTPAKPPKSGKRSPPVPKEIDAKDMADYLATESDFGFEIRVIKQLRSFGFEIQHGGTYMDEITSKPRQFDIRATLSDERRAVRLAVECKNLKKTFPMLVSCLPRMHDEAAYDVGLSINNRVFNFHDLRNSATVWSSTGESLEPRLKRLALAGTNCIYREAEPVGKVVAQVERLTDGQFKVNDADVYQKWSQALSSAVDLVSMLPYEGEQSPLNARFCCVIPVLVVPDKTLCRCGFDFDGNRTLEPAQCDRVQIYINKHCTFSETMRTGTYTLTHLEVVTFSGLTELVARLNTHKAIVPKDFAIQLIGALLPLDEEAFAVSDWLSGFH